MSCGCDPKLFHTCRSLENTNPTTWRNTPAPPVLTRESFERAKEQLRRYEITERPGPRYIFSPESKCFYCGERLFDKTEIEAAADMFGWHVRCVK